MGKKRLLTLQNSGKVAFSKFVDTLQVETNGVETLPKWTCCETTFACLKEIHKHASVQHRPDIERIKQQLLFELADSSPKRKRLRSEIVEVMLPDVLSVTDEYKWLPNELIMDKCGVGQILLFYHYRWIDNTHHVVTWQRELCRRLNLTGKIRVAKEGLNATVGGTKEATEVYIQAVLDHPLFREMTRTDFKTSEGSAQDFPDGLKIGVYAEICPMGVDPESISFTDGGTHVSPMEFHKAVESCTGSEARDDVLLVDCRNFYESKIGAFEGAIQPDIRKFSYWPEYVDKNTELFKDKTVYMYCTGGVRCERGSAYLKHKGVCKDVLQLSGGIHKYMDQYPDGYFRGKLFVFDNRFHIQSNNDIISKCTYCDSEWDHYAPCTSAHCHQLVLSCTQCRSQSFTACCRLCQKNFDNKMHREQCECTARRVRIPMENSSDSMENVEVSVENSKLSEANSVVSVDKSKLSEDTSNVSVNIVGSAVDNVQSVTPSDYDDINTV